MSPNRQKYQAIPDSSATSACCWSASRQRQTGNSCTTAAVNYNRQSTSQLSRQLQIEREACSSGDSSDSSAHQNGATVPQVFCLRSARASSAGVPVSVCARAAVSYLLPSALCSYSRQQQQQLQQQQQTDGMARLCNAAAYMSLCASCCRSECVVRSGVRPCRCARCSACCVQVCAGCATL